MNKLNIITRTHREHYFKVLKNSVMEQTYKNINWIVGSDIECLYHPEAIRLYKDFRVPLYIPMGMYHSPWNMYLNTLALEVKEGWIMYIDDDDEFTCNTSVDEIMSEIDNDNQILVWKVQIQDNWIVPSHSFGKHIKAGDFSGIGFAFHSKHLPVDWGNLSYGDYRVAWQLLQKGLEIKWIDKLLTKTQNGAHNGGR